jgi:drug/metabolite transporter (DMT)-like permease
MQQRLSVVYFQKCLSMTDQKHPPHTNNPGSALSGTLMMSVAMVLIGLVDAIAKHGTTKLHGLQVTWIYFLSVLASLLLGIVLARGRIPFTLRTSLWRLQCLRGICIVGSLSLLFTSLTWLPLAEATVISFTAPLFIVALSGPILGEAVSARMWLAVGFGLLGALLVIRPGSSVFQLASLLPLAGALFFGLFNIVTRRIGSADSAATTSFYTFAFGSLVLSIPQIPVWRSPELVSVAQIAAAGAMGMLAHLLIALSLQRTPVAIVAPLNYVRLVCALTLGYWWFGEVPDALSIVGAVLIVGSGVYTVYCSAAEKRAANQKPAERGMVD